MRRFRLGLVLTVLNVSLALLALSGLTAAAAALLRRFTDQQELSRVQLAAISAERGIAGQGETVAAMAVVLADREAPAASLAARRFQDLSGDLEAFRATAGLTSCAIVHAGRAVAIAGLAIDWADVARAAPAPSYSLAPTGGSTLEVASAAPFAGDPAFVAVVAKSLDAGFAARLSEEVGATARIVDAAAGIGALGDPKLPLRARLLHDAPPEARRLDTLGVYATVRALKGPDGRVAGFLETELPASPAREARLRLVRRLALLTLLIGGAAAVASTLVARRIALPLSRLSDAADRIGGGDLETPVGTTGPAEIGRLASSMDDMRRKLSRLTADLESQKADARAMINGIVEGVFVVDRERRIVQMNPQAASSLGIDARRAIGRFCGDVLKPEGPGGIRPCEENCPILHARFRGEARATELLVLPDGRRRSVVITSSMSGSDRQFQLLRDETELEAARRLRDAVLANISHEFKTPLAAQLASIELLLSRLPELPPDETRRLIVSLQRGALRLNQLIDNLLESVRIEAGRTTLRRRPVHLDEVVEDAVEMIRPLTEQRGQTIEVALPHPLPVIAGDGPRLVQIFVNLLANAAKFAPDGTTIHVGGEVLADGVSLHVEDEGPGWAEDTEPQLFEPFVRSMGEEPESSGIGLGLYIAKSIVERHGGSIEARSRTGRTRVAVKLPVEVAV